MNISSLSSSAITNTSSAHEAASKNLDVSARLEHIMDAPYDDDCMLRQGKELQLHTARTDWGVREDRCQELKAEITKTLPAGPKREAALDAVDEYLKEHKQAFEKLVANIENSADASPGLNRPMKRNRMGGGLV